MSLKSIFLTILLFAAILISVSLFSFSGEAKANNMEYASRIDECDPSQYTYVRVPIGDVIWIFVYDCNGVIIDEYPEY
jgi:hypothetical protein